jgi:leucyl aminopeptidase
LNPIMHKVPLARLIVAAVFAVLLTATILEGPMAEAASDAKASAVAKVSGDRMMATVEALAQFGTRVFYTSSATNSSVYIYDQFADLGLWVYFQHVDVSGFSVRNIVAVLNGSEGNLPQTLFGAHYDSSSGNLWNLSAGGTLPAPGADDDASGVAAVIELATILSEMHLKGTVKFVAFAAEEAGLNGSRYFAEQELAQGVTYSGTAILDMIGYRIGSTNGAMIFQDYGTNPLGSSMVKAVDDYSLALSVIPVTGKDMVSSDHASFWRVGYPSLLVIEKFSSKLPENPYYHTSMDTPDRLSPEQMVEITRMVLGGFLSLNDPLSPSFPVTIVIMICVAAIAVTAGGAIITRKQREPEL